MLCTGLYTILQVSEIALQIFINHEEIFSYSIIFYSSCVLCVHRYRASIIKSTTVKSSMWTCSDSVVRPRKPVKHTTGTVEFSDISLIEVGQRKQQVEDLSPSLSELQDVDPSLVFLCYRGFNHVSGKLQTGKTVLALKV